ncbi:MAG: methyltransferase domain-containing protein [Spartobacteria bacterium]
METNTELELPGNTCAYERYDLKTLEPLNSETFIRLQELGWATPDFFGRTVLDIGCNSGLLTLYALRLGASKVHACDVQPGFVEFFTRVVEARKLPVTVNLIPFHKLNRDEHEADVVLFMEVLHWVVSQGIELRAAVGRLADLTKEILYLEFPWSVTEPSIQKQTKLTAERYSADAVLDELTRYFTDVRVVRFMRYFGFESQSQRVLIEARQKRPEVSVLAQLPSTYSLDVALSRGRNESYLLTSPRGPLVAKLLAPESTLGRIPAALCNRLFDEIHAKQPQTIVAAEKCNDSYRLPAPNNRHWMIFPFIGKLPSAGKAKAFPIDFDRLIDLFIRVRRDFRGLSPDLLKNLEEQRLVRDVKSIASPTALWTKEPGELASIKDGALQAMSGLTHQGNEHLDALCHGDLQTGNFVLDEHDEPRVVDLDTLTLGPIYSDGLIGLIWRGAAADTLANFCQKLRSEEPRSVTVYDVGFAIANGIAWYSAVRQSEPAEVGQEQIGRLRKGLTEALTFASSLS